MNESPITKPGRWLYVFGAIYLLLFIFMRPDREFIAHIRWIGFFILTQTLVQVIFSRFRCSKATNLIVASIVVITTILVSLES